MSQPKIAKNSLKHIFGVQGRSRSSMLEPPESSSAVVVMTSSKSVSVCNHSRARLVDSSRNCTFSRGYPNLMRSCGGRVFCYCSAILFVCLLASCVLLFIVRRFCESRHLNSAAYTTYEEVATCEKVSGRTRMPRTVLVFHFLFCRTCV